MQPGRKSWAVVAAAWCLLGGAGFGQEPASPPEQPAPDPVAAEAKKDEAGSCPDGARFDFKKVPPVRIFPRIGNFPILPSGPGYYSFLDVLHHNRRENPPKFPYGPIGLMQFSFFDADFRYLDDPKNTQHDFWDPVKRVRLGDNWLFSTGGEIRLRYEDQQNARLTQSDNTFTLFRVRTYTDLWYKDEFRVFAEFISAHSFWQDLAPLPIDQNRADFLNLFADAKLFDLDGHAAYVRVGRQELLLGSQRLVSPLEWANTRRTFQGLRAFRQGEKFDVDLFWVQPVAINANELDSVDNNQNFAGAWLTYRPEKGRFLDGYYLMLDNTNRVTQQGIVRAPFTVHTFGTRYAGDLDSEWLWDVEAALQFGRRGSSDIFAGMATTGLGYHFKDAELNPTVWVYYDYASGDRNPNTGTYSTFNQLFPFGHYYLGWLDAVGRQNIHDVNTHLFLYPADWITVWLQYHRFWLAQGRDALYNAAGNAIRRDPTGRAGTNVGNEIDVVLNFRLGPHSDILTGYSKLFGGRFLEQTSSRTAAGNGDFYFMQYSYRW
jgi:hypothetical protein